LQKLADPAFFSAKAPLSFAAQLQFAATNSPVGRLLRPLAHVSTPLAVLAGGELGVGAATLVGLRGPPGGRRRSVPAVFLVTVSWHTHPYYYGSDVCSSSTSPRCPTRTTCSRSATCAA